MSCCSQILTAASFMHSTDVVWIFFLAFFYDLNVVSLWCLCVCSCCAASMLLPVTITQPDMHYIRHHLTSQLTESHTAVLNLVPGCIFCGVKLHSQSTMILFYEHINILQYSGSQSSVTIATQAY